MEEEDGKIAVQLFSDPDKAKESFDNMPGKIGQPPQRATFIKLVYTNTVDDIVAEAWSKDLPVPQVPPEQMPDGYRIGEGPITFKKEEGK
jgi:hypothetical protein